MAGRAVQILINARNNTDPAFRTVGGNVAGLNRQLVGLHSVSLGLKTAMAGAFAGASAGALFSVKQAASVETLTIAFETMLKSGPKARALIEDIRKASADTPLGFLEIADASKKLLAYGFAAEDVIPTIRRLGDVTSLQGENLDEVARIFGKARVQGRLFQEDINQFSGRGIPVLVELKKILKADGEQLREMVADGKVGFRELNQAFINMTSEGATYFQGMERASKGQEGMWSNLKDGVSAVAESFGTELLPFTKLVTGELINLTKNSDEFKKSVQEATDTAVLGFANLIDKLQVLNLGFKAAQGGALMVAQGVAEAAESKRGQSWLRLFGPSFAGVAEMIKPKSGIPKMSEFLGADVRQKEREFEDAVTNRGKTGQSIREKVAAVQAERVADLIEQKRVERFKVLPPKWREGPPADEDRVINRKLRGIPTYPPVYREGMGPTGKTDKAETWLEKIARTNDEMLTIEKRKPRESLLIPGTFY